MSKNPNQRKDAFGKPLNPDAKKNNTNGQNPQSDSDSSNPTKRKKPKQPLAERFSFNPKKRLKRKIKQKAMESDGAVGKTTRAVRKTKQVAKKTKRYTGWLVKYIKFCISNPLGWLCGLLTLVLLGSVGSNFADSMNGAKGSAGPTHNTDGEKATVILMDCKKTSNESATGGTSSDAAADADWLKEGTTAYNNAKIVFDEWTSTGVSGTAAAGLLGWVNTEGGFSIVGRAEGHIGAGKENSIANGAVPVPSGPGYKVGGGGIYQFTPYTKYAPLNDPKWEDPKAMTQFVIGLMPHDWNPAQDASGQNQTFEQWAQQSNIEPAALGWNAYERGNLAFVNKAHKIADAKKANEVFNKDNIQFDRAKFEQSYGSSKNKSSDNNSSSDTKKRKCRDQNEGGSDGWSKKGGKHNYRNHNAWKPQDLPDDLKQYALNPETIGLKYGSSDGWDIYTSGIWNQCTDLSSNLMYHLWEKDGKGPRQARGNGNMVANNWAATYGGSVTKTPSSGAVFSTPGPSQYGHTGVVSHVFDDDSILIIEQNYTGYSGGGNGTTHTWNFRIVTKQAIEAEGYTFYSPGDHGYTTNPKAKSY